MLIHFIYFSTTYANGTRRKKSEFIKPLMFYIMVMVIPTLAIITRLAVDCVSPFFFQRSHLSPRQSSLTHLRLTYQSTTRWQLTMSSLLRQVALLAAGCQPWHKDVCAANGDRFAYCATLAVYIYEVSRMYFAF